MPITFRIDKSSGVIFTSAQGAITDQDPRAFQRALMGDSDFDPNFKHLIDTTDVTEFDVSAAAVLELYLAEMFTDGTRRAVVVPENQSAELEKLYGIVRNFRNEDLRAFRDMDEARLWLEV